MAVINSYEENQRCRKKTVKSALCATSAFCVAALATWLLPQGNPYGILIVTTWVFATAGILIALVTWRDARVRRKQALATWF